MTVKMRRYKVSGEFTVSCYRGTEDGGEPDERIACLAYENDETFDETVDVPAEFRWHQVVRTAIEAAGFESADFFEIDHDPEHVITFDSDNIEVEWIHTEGA